MTVKRRSRRPAAPASADRGVLANASTRRGHAPAGTHPGAGASEQARKTRSDKTPSDKTRAETQRDKDRTIAAMDAMVDAGLAHWSSTPCGSRALNLVTGEVYQLEAVHVRRVR